jgi:hypothetical protein
LLLVQIDSLSAQAEATLSEQEFSKALAWEELKAVAGAVAGERCSRHSENFGDIATQFQLRSKALHFPFNVLACIPWSTDAPTDAPTKVRAALA